MRAWSAALAICLAVGSGLLAAPADPRQPSPETVVLGTGNATIDVPAVQRAVDAGGTVLLRGGFSFGEVWSDPLSGAIYARLDNDPRTPDLELTGAGTDAERAAFAAASKVVIRDSVHIRGERDGAGYMTTVTGGYLAISVYAQDVEVVIEDIHFDRWAVGAVRVYAGNVTIRGNRFTNPQIVAPLTVSPLHPGEPAAAAIGVSEFAWATDALRRQYGLPHVPSLPPVPGRPVPEGFFAWLNDALDPQLQQSLGRIEISGNEIDMQGAADGMSEGASGAHLYGIQCAGAEPEAGRDKSLILVGNHLRHCPGVAISVRGWAGGQAWIEDNEIEGGEYPELHGARMQGIEVAPFLMPPGPTRVAGNRLATMGGPGIEIAGAVGAEISGNSIAMLDSAFRPWDLCTYAGILLRGAKESVVEGNTVSGTAAHAIADYGNALGGQSSYQTDNSFVNNRLDAFTPRGVQADRDHGIAHVPAANVLSYGCLGNHVVGDHGSVLETSGANGAHRPAGWPSSASSTRACLRS